MAEAIASGVRDGYTVSAACGLESRIPFAAAFEIVRQGRKKLRLVGPISDVLYDILIGAGCVTAVEAAWVGNVGAGLGHNFRRAAERGIPHPIEIVDHSNYSMAVALRAAADGMPFGITGSIAGTSMMRDDRFLTLRDPFGVRDVVAVRALEVDVAIVHAQRADALGNAHVWGNLGLTWEASRAAKRCIVVCEELVASSVIASMPERTIVPGLLVDAVVCEPLGSHPSPVIDYVARDHAFFTEYHAATRERAGFEAWLDEWVFEAPTRATYLGRLGRSRVGALRNAK